MSNLRRRASFASSLIALALALGASPAQAQVSDADRAAARELYFAGVRAQEAGRFGEALDKFQRAQSVFSAPTHLLHIAECQAALGHLVESAETYRTLVRTPLPPGAPNAFVQAQQQGNAELPQVEPRIPSVRLMVKPENVQGLEVKVDGQPMNAALVGVQRPINPGPHTISVQAPGYAKVDQPVSVKEKETKDVSVTLVAQPGGAGGGIIYTPAPTQPSTGAASSPPSAAEPPPPPRYDNGPPPPYEASPESKPAAGGFMIGPRIGALAPGGKLYAGEDASKWVGTGWSLGGEGGFRFARRFYFGAVYEHGFQSKGDGVDAIGGALLTNNALSASQSTNYIGLNFIYISNPDGFAFYGELGAGYRSLDLAYTTNDGTNVSSSYGGGEGELALGVHFRAGEWVRIIPKLGFASGTYSKGDCSASGPALTGLTCKDLGTTSGTITNTDSHTFVFFGVTTFFDFARKR